MATTKQFSEWEKLTGLFAVDSKKVDLSEEMTREDFLKLWSENSVDFVGVSYNDRVKFLEANGYEVNRENLLADLSAKPKEES